MGVVRSWWPQTEADEDELGRRATAALAEIGLNIPVAFNNGFVWGAHHTAEHRDEIERACGLAWDSMAR